MSNEPRTPTLGNQIPTRGNCFSRAVGHLYLKIFGWRVSGEFPNRIKLIAVIAPHTSNWDFIHGIFAVFAMGLHAHWLGKHTLFNFPFGAVMHWLGGIAIDRRSAHGAVTQTANALAKADQMLIGITPEGTRKKVKEWKSGFYHLSVEAKVPLVLIYFDYPNKTIGIGREFTPSGDFEREFKEIKEYYRDKLG